MAEQGRRKYVTQTLDRLRFGCVWGGGGVGEGEPGHRSGERLRKSQIY
jgi:hypothetical protein